MRNPRFPAHLPCGCELQLSEQHQVKVFPCEQHFHAYDKLRTMEA